MFGDDKDSLFLTEKIFKPIAYRNSIHGCWYDGDTKTSSLFGYETFPEMFDESYDQEYDPKKRWAIILRNLENWYQTQQMKKCKNITL